MARQHDNKIVSRNQYRKEDNIQMDLRRNRLGRCMLR